ncbi:MAG TPA: DUF1127 domain-containing protein [Pseudolabrys sp.]|nr:DUF1127 domain-containing protein [Pseudolabrys sp.]
MSTLFKSAPGIFTKYENPTLPEAGSFRVRAEACPKKLQNRNASTGREASPLRNDHIVLWAIDGLLALHVAVRKWRERKTTLRALADLDEHQLRDIGLTRDQTHYHALAGLDDAGSERTNGKLLGGRK